ncbi:MAG: DUF1571 domain-containing protein [Pirellulales bacterium]|nr:DUF1571 domain-containing protein [Pirellulales bacterium]
MVLANSFRRSRLTAMLTALLLATLLFYSVKAHGQVGPVPTGPRPPGPMPGPQPRASLQPPPFQGIRLADRMTSIQPPGPTQPGVAQPPEHPLMPALRWAYTGLENIEKIQDYSATLVKRERLDGKVGETEYMFVKVRHKPFSVYLYFLGPPALKGREVIYIDGQNNGNLWAHTTGIQDKLVGTISLKPNGVIAMRGQRYPLTELGILNLVRRLIDVAEQDVKYGECEVNYFKGVKINDRTCTCIQVVHPYPRRNFLFHLARIFVDDELNVAIRYESHSWPPQASGRPELIEEYTYLNLKLNNGFTDRDFDTRNPDYQFR